MAQIKLAKALKLKNKLTKKISELQKQINAHNSIIHSNTRTVNVAEKMEEMIKTIDELTSIKAVIAAANQPVYRHIIKIAELRSHIAFLRKLDTKHGSVAERYGQQVIVYNAHISATDVIKEVEKYEAEIDTLQEIIDAHNHNTTVQVDVAE